MKRPSLRPLPLLLLAATAAPVATAAPPAPANEPAASCKAYGGAKCCDPRVSRHLAKEAIFAACGESEATYLGEKAGKESCRHVFKVKDSEGKTGEDIVEIYAPVQKDVPPEPTDPFFSWKKVGKVFVTDKAKSPKSMPMLASGTGLWMPGAGFFVSVNASTKVCTKAEAMRLAKAVK